MTFQTLRDLNCFNWEKIDELQHTDEYMSIHDDIHTLCSQIYNRAENLGYRYTSHAGEGEARNAETRAYWSNKRRRFTPLDASEDMPRDKQIVGRLPKSMEYFKNYRTEHPDRFIVPDDTERFYQLVGHATDNIILGNKFDLRYVGTNTGSFFFTSGMGLSKEIAEKYRRFGKSERKGNIYIFDIPEDYELLDWHTPLSLQPVDVKMKLRRLMNELRRRVYFPQQVCLTTRITNLSGIEKSSLDPKDITEGALYQSVVNIFLNEEGQTGRFNLYDRTLK